MSANTIFSTIAHMPSRSTTGNDPLWPDGSLASHARLHTAAKRGIGPADSKPVSQSHAHNRMLPVPRRFRHTRPTRAKSP